MEFKNKNKNIPQLKEFFNRIVSRRNVIKIGFFLLNSLALFFFYFVKCEIITFRIFFFLCRFDFDESTFSPPSHDDSFFYIRYPKTQNRLSVSQDFRPIDEVFNEQNITPSTNNIKTQDTQQQIIEEKKKNQEIDFSKHPLPCQPFIPTTNKGININYYMYFFVRFVII